MDKKYFYFNEFCFLVKGQRKAALYNLLDGEVFSLDEDKAKILADTGASTAEKLKLAHSLGTGEEEVFALLEDLVSSGMGRYSEKSLFADKINLDFKENILKRGMINLNEIILKVTGKCSFNCVFCKPGKSQLCFPCSRLAPGAAENRLAANIEEIITDAALVGGDTVRFVGGDPFLEGETFLRMLAYAAVKIKNIEVISNLSALTPSQIEEFAGYKNVRVFYPFFGCKKEVFSAITRHGKSFGEVVRNALDLKSRGIGATALIMKRRQGTEEDIAFCEARGLDYKVFAPTPLRENKEIFDFFDGFSVEEADFPNTYHENFFSRKNYHSCLARSISLHMNGDVTPCLYSYDSVYGNIGSRSLRDILREGKQEKYWYLSKDSVSGCRGCEFRYGCSADCITAARNLGGKINARYPFCNYDPQTGEWQGSGREA